MIPDSATIQRWNSRDAPLAVQVVKYGICGGAATFVQLVVVFGLAYSILPAMDGMLVGGESITDTLRERNLMLANVAAFPFANLTAYYLNVLWVFTPGRHDRWREFGLFTVIAAISFFAGLVGGPKLIGWFGVPSVFAQFAFLITAALVNFICRKFLVFSR